MKLREVALIVVGIVLVIIMGVTYLQEYRTNQEMRVRQATEETDK